MTNPKYRLRLFVSGSSSHSLRAVGNLKRICRDELGDQFDLEIIDVLEQPEQAEAAKVLATPTLIRELPPPIRRIIGDLSQSDEVLLGLDVTPTDSGGE
ncbi:MAG: circadian clock KaiB family protein [Sandaracinaceae bacterium]